MIYFIVWHLEKVKFCYKNVDYFIVRIFPSLPKEIKI